MGHIRAILVAEIVRFRVVGKTIVEGLLLQTFGTDPARAALKANMLLKTEMAQTLDPFHVFDQQQPRIVANVSRIPLSLPSIQL